MSKTVDDLVEKVARAMAGDDDIVGHKDGPLGWMYYRQPARAAIAAVAEWLEVDVGTPSAYVTADNLREQVAPTLRTLALEAKP